MFRMLGTKTELYRYRVIWQEDEQERQENCISEQHKDEIEQMLVDRSADYVVEEGDQMPVDRSIDYVVEEVDQTGNEWFDGLEFNSYDKALEVFSQGQTAYEQQMAREQLIDNLRLRADIDYLSIMSGVEI